ncbi:hypothetical protein JB92DRAFT_3188648 [Gautieria morchelliformis]|nr:hypothetical protein JB92DRAFT_3188648 [Gautieria morchelliformis]
MDMIHNHACHAMLTRSFLAGKLMILEQGALRVYHGLKKNGIRIDMLLTRLTYSVDLIKWWDHNEGNYPWLSHWALDYFPAQASSVPAERIFSSSAETDTRRRNRISPHLMEQLQMLKFMIKKAQLYFWKWEGKDIEQENEWQDQGYFVCAKPHSAFDQQLDILSDKDGNVQETNGEPSRGSGKNSTDLELEGFAFKGCDEWEEEFIYFLSQTISQRLTQLPDYQSLNNAVGSLPPPALFTFPFPSILTHVVGLLGEEFKSLIRPYLLNGLIKGIPSLFVDVRALYVDNDK